MYEKLAKYYDIIFGESYLLRPETDMKRIETNIPAQIEFLEWVLAGKKKILDAGCGTGRYLIPLAEKGHEVVGIDTSSEMLSILRKKLAECNSKIRTSVYCADMRNVDFEAEFDAAICMYTFNYLISDEDIMRTLRGLYNSLKRDGIVVIDIHNFLYHLDNFEKVTIDHFEKDNIHIQRIIRYDVDNVTCICYYDEYATINEAGKVSTYHEVHPLRIMTHNEMRKFLTEANFGNIKCFADYTTKEAKKSAHRLVFVGEK
ncbi:MAG: hypothetical protein AYK18_17565 [Theionarchaea archaeon DG-70]|nr:MAG: hypothetical protein AYK18_17565 [Theionarchaea archaeon DG-70]